MSKKMLAAAGMTHVLVRTLSKEDSAVSGAEAYIDLCFGPGDDDAIQNIPWKRLGKQMSFVTPLTACVREGKKVVLPVFRGMKFNQAITEACSFALDKIRQDLGGVKRGKTYRVNAKGATEDGN